MKKRFLSVAAGVLAVSAMLAGCGSGAAKSDGGADTQKSAAESKSDESKSDTATASGDALRLINGKIEIDAQLKKAAEKFKEKTGQEVVIESLGGGVDIQGQIKSYKAADNMPDKNYNIIIFIG